MRLASQPSGRGSIHRRWHSVVTGLRGSGLPTRPRSRLPLRISYEASERVTVWTVAGHGAGGLMLNPGAGAPI